MGDTCSGSWSSGWRLEVAGRLLRPRAARRACLLAAWWSLPTLEHLREPPLKPSLVARRRTSSTNIFHRMAEGEMLLHHPYESFDPVVAFVRAGRGRSRRAGHQADAVPHERRQPRRVQALARRGRRRASRSRCIVELMARFDEQSNIQVGASASRQSGAHVIYGIRGYKTHAKICLVVRRGPQGIERYVHMGTGQLQREDRRASTRTSAS